MLMINQDLIEQFCKLHPEAKGAFQPFIKIIESNSFPNSHGLHNSFSRSVNRVKPYYVFDIGGNKYRLIAKINFQVQIVSIRRVLTHKEYDKGDWKT